MSSSDELQWRIDDLEQVIETQGVLIGRCLDLLAQNQPVAMTRWLHAVMHDSRDDITWTPMQNQFMDGLLYGAAVELAPQTAQLRVPA